MSPYLPSFGLIFLASALISAALTPLAVRLGLRSGLADKPGGRRQHGRVISRLGGIGLFVGFAVAVGLTVLLPANWLPPRLDTNEMRRLAGLLIGSSAVFVFGLLDDRFQFRSRPQYLAQFVSALIAIAFIIFIEIVNNPLTNRPVHLPALVVGGADDFLVYGDDQHRQLARRVGRAGRGGYSDHVSVSRHPHGA